MENLKVLLKILLFTLIILLITVGIPTYYFNEYSNSQYLDNIQDSNFQGPAGYLSNILTDTNSTDSINDNATGLFNNFKNMLNGKSKDLLNLYFSVAMLLGIALFSLGIVIYKLESRIISLSFICSGFISIITYILIYIMVINVLQ